MRWRSALYDGVVVCVWTEWNAMNTLLMIHSFHATQLTTIKGSAIYATLFFFSCTTICRLVNHLGRFAWRMSSFLKKVFYVHAKFDESESERERVWKVSLACRLVAKLSKSLPNTCEAKLPLQLSWYKRELVAHLVPSFFLLEPVCLLVCLNEPWFTFTRASLSVLCSLQTASAKRLMKLFLNCL